MTMTKGNDGYVIKTDVKNIALIIIYDYSRPVAVWCHSWVCGARYIDNQCSCGVTRGFVVLDI